MNHVKSSVVTGGWIIFVLMVFTDFLFQSSRLSLWEVLVFWGATVEVLSLFKLSFCVNLDWLISFDFSCFFFVFSIIDEFFCESKKKFSKKYFVQNDASDSFSRESESSFHFREHNKQKENDGNIISIILWLVLRWL